MIPQHNGLPRNHGRQLSWVLGVQQCFICIQILIGKWLLSWPIKLLKIFLIHTLVYYLGNLNSQRKKIKQPATLNQIEMQRVKKKSFHAGQAALV